MSSPVIATTLLRTADCLKRMGRLNRRRMRIRNPGWGATRQGV